MLVTVWRFPKIRCVCVCESFVLFILFFWVGGGWGGGGEGGGGGVPITRFKAFLGPYCGILKNQTTIWAPAMMHFDLAFGGGKVGGCLAMDHGQQDKSQNAADFKDLT